MDLIKGLIEKGYTPYRVFNNREEKECKNNYFFSSVQDGYLHLILKKNNIRIVYGLNEYGFPPTLISPRCYIKEKDGSLYYARDSDINGHMIKSDFNNVYKDILRYKFKNKTTII